MPTEQQEKPEPTRIVPPVTMPEPPYHAGEGVHPDGNYEPYDEPVKAK